MVARKLETRERIKEFIEANPDALKKDICKAVGISPITLRSHLEQINVI